MARGDHARGGQGRGYSFGQALVFAAAWILLVLAFLAVPLDEWARSIGDEGSRARAVATAVSGWILATDASLGLDRPYRAARGAVLALGVGMAAVAVLPEPPAEAPPRAAAETAYTAERPLSILLVGDSLAWNHIPTMFNEAIKGEERIRFRHVYKISSTLSDPSVYDWLGNIGAILAQGEAGGAPPYDLVIATIGGNDAQGIATAEGRLAYPGPGWTAEFTSRVSSFMGLLSARSKKVYWLSIPPMRKEGYKDRMAHINDLYREVSSAFPKVVWVDLDRLVGDGEGLFTPTKLIGGRLQFVRSKDGTHYDYAGARLVVDRLLGLIRADFPSLMTVDPPASGSGGD